MFVEILGLMWRSVQALSLPPAKTVAEHTATQSELPQNPWGPSLAEVTATAIWKAIKFNRDTKGSEGEMEGRPRGADFTVPTDGVHRADQGYPYRKNIG